MQGRSSAALPLWFACCAFVVYGSLVPLDFRSLTLADAWEAFRHAPVRRIGAEHRADWISNIVLYLPVGFLSSHALMQRWPRLPRGPLLLAAAMFSLALAVAVEFAQLFFPPRTVSLNDLFAEAVGSLAGIAIAARWSGWVAEALRNAPLAVRRIDDRWLVLYVLAYAGLSLFPYDFILSSEEFDRKLASSSWGFFVASASQGRLLGLLRLLAEIVAALPVGWWLAGRARRPLRLATAAAVGALLGAGIELAQFFMLSGLSQGLSVAVRAGGVVLGTVLWRHRADCSAARIGSLLRRHGWLLGGLYLLLLLRAGHWFSAHWQSSDEALRQLREIRFLPFYYHYFTTELAAVTSLVTVALLYAPAGVGAWAARREASFAAGIAALLAAVVEAGKLFGAGGHADPSNLLVAAAAAWLAHRLASVLEQDAARPFVAAGRPAPTVGPSRPARHRAGTPAGARRRNPAAWLAWLPAVGLATWLAADFPVLPGLLLALLAAATLVVWRRPALLFLIVPAALPVLDLAPWSGRVLVDEFDLLLLATLATVHARLPAPVPGRPDRLLRGATALVVLAVSIGIVRGLWPWQGFEALSAVSPYGPWNALRIGKGAAWALLLCTAWRRVAAAGADPWRPLAIGATLGLASAVAVVGWERMAFADLLDFSSDYRVTGLFSAMHNGGAYVECFLVVALPFLLGLTLDARHAANRWLGVALLGAATYAAMVTFSRAGQFAFAVVVVAMLALRLAAGRTRSALSWVGSAALAALIAAIAVPVLLGPYERARAQAVSGDLDTRLRHWAQVTALGPGDGVTALLGHGFGRFPEAHYWAHVEDGPPGTYRLQGGPGMPHLRLGGGARLYVEQFVAIEPQQRYTLKMRVRSATAGTQASVSICEKWLLTSFDCVRLPVQAGPLANEWQPIEIAFDSRRLGSTPWYAKRPVKLALQSPAKGQVLDVAQLELRDAGQRELLDNGDFSRGMDHWFDSADDHLAWHTKSLPLALWFDLGWLGVAAFAGFVALALGRAARAAAAGDARRCVALSALAGFLLIGLFDSLVDAPRFMLLLLALCALCLAGPPGRAK